MLTIYETAHTPPSAVRNGERIALHGPPAPMRGIYEATYGDEKTRSLSDCPIVAARISADIAWRLGCHAKGVRQMIEASIRRAIRAATKEAITHENARCLNIVRNSETPRRYTEPIIDEIARDITTPTRRSRK